MVCSIYTTGRCQPDIISRIGIASTAMHSMNKVWRQTRLQLQIKLPLYQTCILSILLYGSETWTLLQEDLRKLDVFHMRSLQRMILGIRWHDFVRNSEVVARTILPCVQEIIARRRNSLFGHVVIDSMTTRQPTAHYHRSQQQVAAMARTPAIQQIGDGTPFSILTEWSNARRRGHSRLTQRTFAVYAI